MPAHQGNSLSSPSVTIRRCSSHDEYQNCIDLQKSVWRFDSVDIVPHHVLVVAAETGGQVIGASHGGRMVGFVQAFAATRNSKVYLHSHMLAVHPEYQGHGIGTLLKMAQREDAISRNIDVIEWTFDPLEVRNAHFNIERLGAIVRRYVPDLYGRSSSPLHARLPTDRLVAEWQLMSPRVQAHVTGTGSGQTSGADAISVPRNIGDMRRDQPVLATEIQARIRREFLEAFKSGHAVTGFTVTDTDGKYLLEPLA